MNSETFGIPLRHGRGRSGFRGRGGSPGFRGGRGRAASRGSFAPSRGGGVGFRGGFRGGRGGREFSDFEYRVSADSLISLINQNLSSSRIRSMSVCVLCFRRRIKCQRS